MMELFIGGTGDGKTLEAMRRICDHLNNGGVAACNFHLKPGWAWRMAARSYDCTVLGKPLADVARSFWQRMFLAGRPDTIVQFSQLLPALVDGPAAKRFDRRGLLVLDEAHFYIDPVNYRNNGPWLRIFNQQRKMKIHCILITNDASFLDAKIRKLFKVIWQSINLHEHWRVPGTDYCWPRPDWRPGIPRPSYIHRRWSALTKSKVHFRFTRHHTWIQDLYDTDEQFDFDSLPSVLESQGLLGDNPLLAAEPAPQAQRPAWTRQRDANGCCDLYNFLPSAQTFSAVACPLR